MIEGTLFVNRSRAKHRNWQRPAKLVEEKRFDRPRLREQPGPGAPVTDKGGSPDKSAPGYTAELRHLFGAFNSDQRLPLLPIVSDLPHFPSLTVPFTHSTP